jgi:ABC-type sugar transport system substrate-binding protein
LTCFAATNENIKIGVFIPNAGDPYYQNKAYGYFQAEVLLKYMQNINVELVLYDAGGYEFPLTQIQQIEDSIQGGMDAMIVTACDAAGLVPVVEKALEDGVIVIADDVMVNTETTSKISENSIHVGEVQAQFIVERLGEKGNVVMLLGPPGADIAQERAKGAIECFEKYPGINILGKQWHDGNMSDSLKKMEDFIQAYGEDIDAVYTFDSVSAFAAAEALESAGHKPGDVVIATTDLHSEAIKYMEEGWITATIPCQPIKLARSAVLYAAKAVQGEKIPKRIYTGDEIIITIENFKNFDTSDAMAPEGWKPTI